MVKTEMLKKIDDFVENWQKDENPYLRIDIQDCELPCNELDEKLPEIVESYDFENSKKELVLEINKIILEQYYDSKIKSFTKEKNLSDEYFGRRNAI